jgi:hypothetical protein
MGEPGPGTRHHLPRFLQGFFGAVESVNVIETLRSGNPVRTPATDRQETLLLRILPARRLSLWGLEAWKEVLRAGYEGLVAKDPESPYVLGRTLKWLKVKQPKYREEERGFYRK